LNSRELPEPSPARFLGVFLHDWAALMSGVVSVPFTALAVFAEARYAKAIWAALALLCWLFTTYRVWASERRALVVERAKTSRPQISVSILGGTLQRSGVAISGYRQGVLEEEFQLCLTLIATSANAHPTPASIDSCTLAVSIPSRIIQGERLIDIPQNDIRHDAQRRVAGPVGAFVANRRGNIDDAAIGSAWQRPWRRSFPVKLSDSVSLPSAGAIPSMDRTRVCLRSSV